MIPLITSIVHALLYDAMAVRRWLRGACLACAAGGMGFADQLAAVMNAPGYVKHIKAVAIVCGFIAGAISVGERNIRPDSTIPQPVQKA